MTLTCKTSHKLRYEHVCDKLPVDNSILTIEYEKEGQVFTKGDKKKKSKRLFYNQLTLEVLLGDQKKVNCKVFTNGVIQMTGCRTRYDAHNASAIVVDAVERINGYDIENKGDLVSIRNYSIRLINSNFNIGADRVIDRYELYNVLNANFDFLLSYFNPDQYPGVKVYFKYYQDDDMYDWKTINVCQWLTSIKGDVCIPIFFKHNITGKDLIKLSHKKLIAMGIDDFSIRDKIYRAINSKKLVKTVTIIVFRTGQIIITGANSLAQLYSAYDFINNTIDTYYSDVIMYTGKEDEDEDEDED